MAELINDMYLVDSDEYKELTNPNKTYTKVTKTSATQIVRSLLNFHGEKCYLDDQNIDEEDWCCSRCPVYLVLGREGGRLCEREKVWSK